MRKDYPYLQDEQFLYKIDSAHSTEQFVKITALDWSEQPLEGIEGLITGGNISGNGDSALRRTINLTASFKKDNIAQITNINNIFSLNKKVYLEIGFKNTTNQYTNYPIIWFPQGTYIIMNCSINHDLNGISISAQLYDKMALQNGSCGGTIPASTRLDTYETVDENGNKIVSKPTIDMIITELVNHFGQEQLSKIVVSDVPKRIKMVMKWLGNSPLYFYKNGDNYEMTTNYDTASQYTYTPYYYNDNIGYIYTDFTYTEELIANAGENVCSELDKIKSFLGGNYEYFYDVYGIFRFQEKKNYLNTSHTKVVLDELNNEDYLLDMSKGKRAYDFSDKPIVVSYSNTPQYNNVKNDFVVWGLRKNNEGINVPIRFHLAIDTKPKTGNIYEVFFYTDPDDGIVKAKKPVEYSSASAFPQPGAAGVFYQDMSNGKIYKWENGEYIELIGVTMDRIMTTDWRSELYLQGVAAEPLGRNSNYYYAELANEWPQIYNLKAEAHTDGQGTYYTGDFYEEVKKDPSMINYFLDFIDSTAAISQFNVAAIGRRSMVENNEDFNCVFEPDIPDFVIIEAGSEHAAEERAECEARGQKYIQVDSNIYNALGTGGGLNSCFTEVKNLLYMYTGYNESIQLQTLPLYHIEPNIRIGAKDPLSDIYGDYVIQSYSLPLSIGTMSINAIRANEKL